MVKMTLFQIKVVRCRQVSRMLVFCTEYFLAGDTTYELNWNELILMLIPEIMTSIGLLICIINANLHKLQ